MSWSLNILSVFGRKAVLTKWKSDQLTHQYLPSTRGSPEFSRVWSWIFIVRGIVVQQDLSVVFHLLWCFNESAAMHYFGSWFAEALIEKNLGLKFTFLQQIFLDSDSSTVHLPSSSPLLTIRHKTESRKGNIQGEKDTANVWRQGFFIRISCGMKELWPETLTVFLSRDLAWHAFKHLPLFASTGSKILPRAYSWRHR